MSVISKEYAPSVMYALLDTAPRSVLKLPMDWPVVKVPCRLLCFRQSITTGGRIPTRQLTNNRRIDPVLPILCFLDQKWDSRSRLGNDPHRRQAPRHRA
jgi:hypothetical protein